MLRDDVDVTRAAAAKMPPPRHEIAQHSLPLNTRQHPTLARQAERARVDGHLIITSDDIICHLEEITCNMRMRRAGAMGPSRISPPVDDSLAISMPATSIKDTLKRDYFDFRPAENSYQCHVGFHYCRRRRHRIYFH